MGPRRLREGREREITLLLKQSTPYQPPEQALPPPVVVVDQLERRLPCGSVSDRNWRSVAVSFAEAVVVVEVAEQGRREKMAVVQRRRRKRERGGTSMDGRREEEV